VALREAMTPPNAAADACGKKYWPSANAVITPALFTSSVLVRLA
jgi:hypothetical protein